ncbi:MAG: hypothetical protein ACQERF_06385 [Actinomycetota bacterium]
MFIDPSSAVAGVMAAQYQLDRAMEALAVADPEPWQGAAATAYTTARDAARVSAHVAEARLRHARECVRAFEQECSTWAGFPGGWHR